MIVGIIVSLSFVITSLFSSIAYLTAIDIIGSMSLLLIECYYCYDILFVVIVI